MKVRDELKWRAAAHIVLLVLTFLAIAPFVLLVISSFTDEESVMANGYSYFPQKWSLDAYYYIAGQAGVIGRAYGITILVTVLGTILGLILTITLAYMLSKKDLPGRNIISFLVIFTMLFNGGLVPTYLIYAQMFHIKDTIWALVVPSLLMNAFNVMLVRKYFETSIPEELYESARIDGASEFLILFRIALPLAKPILATIGFLIGIAYWNDWQNGLYYLNDTSLYSVQNILNQINQNISFLKSYSTSAVNTSQLPTTTVRMAIAVVGILPILVVYPFIQKYLVQGITMGAVKG